MRLLVGLLMLLGACTQASAQVGLLAPPVNMEKYQDDYVIVISTAERVLYYKTPSAIMSFPIGVGRDGFRIQGNYIVGRKEENPDWIPPPEMRARQPTLPDRVKGGDPRNPLGVRALYLHQNGKDSLYRIHGTNEPSTIGEALSSGCIRLINEDVKFLFEMVPMGTKVVVLKQ